MTNNWGIIGTGRIASRLAGAIEECDSATLLSVGSRDADKARAFADQHGAKRAHGSYDDLLADPDVRFVYNSLPNSLHCEWTVKAAEAGKHILCEKPISGTVDEAEAMFDAAERCGVVLIEAFMYRCHPQIARVKQIVDSGEIGDLKLIRARFSYGKSDPTDIRFNKELHGGGLMDVGCYCTNFSRFIAGAEPLQVYGAAVFGPVSGVDESFAATLVFPGGVLAQFDAGMVFAGAANADIMGSKGIIEVHSPWLPGDETSITVSVAGETRQEEFGRTNNYCLEVEQIQMCANEGARPFLTRADTVGNMRAICAMLESARSDQAVSLAPAD